MLHGSSAIIGPDGGYVEAPVYDEDRVIVAEVDLDRMREESMTLDVTTTTLARSSSSSGRCTPVVVASNAIRTLLKQFCRPYNLALEEARWHAPQPV